MTTVTIKNDTHRKLKNLKKKKGFRSFDEMLNHIAEEELNVPDIDEMFGSMTIEDRDKLREHKDRSDRYD